MIWGANLAIFFYKLALFMRYEFANRPTIGSACFAYERRSLRATDAPIAKPIAIAP
jgi:hypothetical protein